MIFESAAPSQPLVPSVVGLPRMRGGLWTDAVRRMARSRRAVAGAAIVLTLVLVAVFAPVLAPTGYAVGALRGNYATPGLEFPLGADFLGRDMLSRLIYGARVSLAVGVVGGTLATVIGVAYGAISGYYGGRVDNWMMRIVDVLYGLPTVLVIILIMVYFRSTALSGGSSNPLVTAVDGVDDLTGGVFLILVGIGITSWLTTSRLVRGMVLSLKEEYFIEAAHAVGASDARIVYRHLLPNFLGPVIVAETLNVPGYILIESFLSFIGLGRRTLDAELGRHDRRRVPGPAVLSAPGHLPCDRALGNASGVQPPWRWPPGRSRSSYSLTAAHAGWREQQSAHTRCSSPRTLAERVTKFTNNPRRANFVQTLSKPR